MAAAPRSVEAEVVTDVVLNVFRLNGVLLTAGDAVVAEHGLTAARWQVLGAIALSEQSLTVPQIARRMGLTRQSVHVSVRRLADDGLVRFSSNADHRRSQRVELTAQGETTYAAVDARWNAWADRLAQGLATPSLRTTASALAELCARIEAGTTTRGARS